ncbi:MULTISPECIES: adenylate/guanylate cyclase domain-containing protein [Rhizobium]|uniref:Adenylate/guanylate cyclase domain-containing protein n=1 Tax=Rhizobium sophoriradicis TaxID=1535245 RepID=A0A2A5KQU4_9HYPH|nr:MULTISPECIES: adenylate/guanylate cyclase domain-containing protein [Rhizobium]ARQ59946.1 adenylate cyclase protein [Rhizobium sp. Kim5]PCK79373.1 adenylate/guanylate cyclase domain-containing protein [Rhizobium sophoriradicis]RSC04972.1 adenylate/guanylate cyclase domain-containing protein [Rhizobium sophoriradicis]UWU33905.1 adenylate/guanylate cyclase domain-containing protein [Rhizobium leguminosarum bv. phaseoli]
MERRLSAILAADVVGYSRLMGVDESGTLQALNRHRCELVDIRISDYKGRIVKLTGDGILAEFQSVVNAVACAAEIQRSMSTRNENVPKDERVEFRIGINLGDVVVENGDIFGDGVNLAARLERIAAPGGIAVSASVRDQVGSRLNLGFEFIGEHMLKNIRQPVQVYTVTLTPPSSARLTAQNRNTCFIAVLPFTNMSGDADQDYFSDGITEDIITDLSKISSLHVVPRNTIFTYKGISVKLKRLAQELGVRYVLEGSVRIFDKRVRISGQLIDTANGDHLWAERYDRDLTDIFAIQDEITHAIVGQLKVRLLPEEKKAIANEPTANVEAYTYYLRGRQLSHTWTKSYLQLARRMFCKAVELDPDYARAYAGIADCDAAIRDWAPDDVPLGRILEMSARALALDPDLPEAHASHGLALHQSGYDDRAAAAFERALTLDPNLFEANFHYARFFFMHGNFAESVQYFTRAAEIRPDDYVSPIHLMAAYHSLGRGVDRENWARLGLLRAERALNLNPENSGPAHRGALALAHLGDVKRARDWAARAIAIDPDDIVAQYNLACVYSVLGDVDQAIDLLEKLLPHSSVYHIKWFNNDSDLDNIRDDPRFQKLLAAAMTQREEMERAGS